MKKLLTSCAAAAVLTSSAFAALNDGVTDLSPNGMGDFLIAPAYYATGNFQSEVKLVNSNQDHSVVVRAVVRDSANSNEVDFLIALSPGDVWSATIYDDGNGNAMIYSDDDSNYGKYATQTAKSDALSVNLTGVNPNAGGKFNQGYIEFYPMVAFDETAYTAAGATVALADNNTVNQAVMAFDSSLGVNCEIGYHVDKNSIVRRYENLAYGTSLDSKYNIGTVTYTNVGDWLFGDITVSSSSMNAAMTLPLRAISDASMDVTGITWSQTLPTLDTVAGLYIDETATEDALEVDQINILFDNDGYNHNILMTMWNDHTSGTQQRTFNLQARNYTECKMGCNTTPCSTSSVSSTSSTISGCLTCGGISSTSSSSTSTSLPDPISGVVSSSSSSVAPTPCTNPLACTYTVNNEFAQASVAGLLSTTTSCSGEWDKGWIRLYNLTSNTNADGDSDSNTFPIIPTQMKAAYVNGQVSYNWNYLSFQ